MREVAHWIGGTEWLPDRRKIEVVNPATGKQIAMLVAGDADDVDAAVADAEQGADRWAALDVATRSKLLHAWADLIDGHAEELAELDVTDTGKPYGVAAASVGRAAATLRWFAGWAPTIRGATMPVGESELTYTTYEPYGVVAAITPWNYPASNFTTKVAPILACGNSVVVKPAEQAPLVPQRLAELATAAGLPDGVVNIVHGTGPVAGAALAAHPGVKKVAFTGSSATGLALQESAGQVKSFTLELGGKTASLVLADADLETAADAAVHTAFVNSGQTCTAGSRVLVPAEHHAAFVDLLLDRISRLQVGDPADPATHVGPLISDHQLERVTEFVESGRQQGGDVLCGGHRLQRDGFYYAPTLVDRVAPETTLFNEEVFGPVLTVTPYSGFDEGVRLANDTEYGLATIIWGTDRAAVRRAVSAVDAGIVWVNTVHRLHPGVPYAGRGLSGVGAEMGIEAVHEYMQPKTVWLGDDEWRSPWV